MGRYVSIWFRFLQTDCISIREPELRKTPFVITASSHGRMIVIGANELATAMGIVRGMVLADARAIVPHLKVQQEKPQVVERLLKKIARWCIRFTPVVALDPPDGIILDATGCSHLWGGDQQYINDLENRIRTKGYDVRVAMADTIGAAWALARFSSETVVNSDHLVQALIPLSPAALRLDPGSIDMLYKLGLRRIGSFLSMPDSVLRRRFGEGFLKKVRQALGREEEFITPVIPVAEYQERLPALDPVIHAAGIETALEILCRKICEKLRAEQKGIRRALFRLYKTDNTTQEIGIETSRPSQNAEHIYKLFQLKIATILAEPGVELFVIEASAVDNYVPLQEKIWETTGYGINETLLGELVDRLSGRLGASRIYRFLPVEHYWPERSVERVTGLEIMKRTDWRPDVSRPVQLLPYPEEVDVTAPIPDYPPMMFRYKGRLHKVIKADGPERIEQEWWIQDGEHRDYYSVENEEGQRYWLFRLGHYSDMQSPKWYLHGYFS